MKAITHPTPNAVACITTCWAAVKFKDNFECQQVDFTLIQMAEFTLCPNFRVTEQCGI